MKKLVISAIVFTTGVALITSLTLLLDKPVKDRQTVIAAGITFIAAIASAFTAARVSPLAATAPGNPAVAIASVNADIIGFTAICIICASFIASIAAIGDIIGGIVSTIFFGLLASTAILGIGIAIVTIGVIFVAIGATAAFTATENKRLTDPFYVSPQKPPINPCNSLMAGIILLAILLINFGILYGLPILFHLKK